MAQIERSGIVSFGDASVTAVEDSIPCAWGGGIERMEWERAFKRQVFARVVQQLNRLGWQLVIPADMVERYGRSFAEDYRSCAKGDLKGELRISGRVVEFHMFQNVHAPNRPDHDGRYEFNKEELMPYMLRLEMERTRLKIRDYLCNVFSGYSFKQKPPKIGINGATALEVILRDYAESWHLDKSIGRPRGDQAAYNNQSADGGTVAHDTVVWFLDSKGRWWQGRAYDNINNMWWVVCGKYMRRNLASFELFVSRPQNLREKRNGVLREKRLGQELASAVADMNFERACVLRDLLHPQGVDVVVEEVV